jgi:hypothetical protein
VVVLVPEATLESKVDALDVKAGRLSGVLSHFISTILCLGEKRSGLEPFWEEHSEAVWVRVCILANSSFCDTSWNEV